MFYNNNRFTNMAGIEVEPNMAYAHENGALVAMIEGYENERALFEAAIMTDVQEASMIAEGASEEEISALQESAIGSFFTKIKELFKKLWEKIKAVFHGFIARFDSLFKGDAALVKKYGTEVKNKDFSGVEFKFCKAKHNEIVPAPATTALQVSFADNEELDEDKFTAHRLAQLSGCKCEEAKDFAKDFHEFLFEDENDINGNTLKDVVIDELSKKEVTKSAENINKALSAAINNIIKGIDAEEKKFKDATEKNGTAVVARSMRADVDGEKGKAGKAVAGGGDSLDLGKGNNDNRVQGGKIIDTLRKKAKCYQTAISTYAHNSIAELKWYHSQCRSVFGRMAASRGAKKEDAMFLDAVEDAILYETDLMFRENIEVAAE